MQLWGSYFNAEAIRVFALFSGSAFTSGLLSAYLINWIGASKPGSVSGLSDVVKFGGPVAGFAAAIVISNHLGWLSIRATPWQYVKAALGAGIAMPAAFVAFIGLSVLITSVLEWFIPSMTSEHPLYTAGAYLAVALGGSVFPLLTGYALRTVTGVWDWWLLGAIAVVMWPALLMPLPWDRPFVSIVGGLIGLWLARSPAAG